MRFFAFAGVVDEKRRTLIERSVKPRVATLIDLARMVARTALRKGSMMSYYKPRPTAQ